MQGRPGLLAPCSLEIPRALALHADIEVPMGTWGHGTKWLFPGDHTWAAPIGQPGGPHNRMFGPPGPQVWQDRTYVACTSC